MERMMMRGIIFALCLLLPYAHARKKRVLHELFELSDSCRKLYVNVDDHDEIDIKSMEQPVAQHSVLADSTCMAYFKTTQPGQGLCIRMQGMLISSEHVKLEIYTGPYGPERIFRRNSPWRGNWCFPHHLLAVRIMTSAYEANVHRAAMYSFAVTNVSMDTIPRRYYLDSFVECGFSHKLTSDQKVILEGEREPGVTPDLPDTCELTFETTSQDKYEQLCIELKVLKPLVRPTFDITEREEDLRHQKESARALVLEGLNARFYSAGEALDGMVVCSENKRLTLRLIRNDSAPFNFEATVTSQWHPNWEKEESEEGELRGLRAVKGITYFIATIDSLIAVFAAGLAMILKRPAGPWRRWVEEFNAHATAHAPQSYPAPDPASYGSMHTCKDGNYPELPLEGATPTNEVLVEAHTY